MKNNPIFNIQSIRAVAAVSVAYYHLQAMINDAYLTNLGLYFPSVGVDIFFVVSGFVMFITNSNLDRPVTKFIWERLVRIVPLYWLSTILIVALYQVGFHPNGLNYFEPYMLLQSLFFVKSEFPDGRIDLILNLGWTLTYELFFYAIFAMTFKFKSINRSFLFLLVSFSMLVSTGLIFSKIPEYVSFFMKPIILEFVFGCSIGLMYLRWQELYHKSSILTVFFGTGFIVLGMLLILILESYRVNVPSLENLRLFYWGVPAFFIVTGAILLEKCGFYIRGKFMLSLGAASYSLYLFHPVIMQATVKVFHKVFLEKNDINAVVAIITSVSVTIALSIILSIYVEAKILYIGRSIINKKY